eukprot:CAMPEP_0194030538 /NCGR_PEP_ID=MMETSP0009_2-20130614/3984_1 /TAXON_ID=210454 /ORGANISM="Grammatophora oceanica, Strain CCMP 410" /LENGTH=206 /DNA_ID=CAMNT_0038670501 /DNA_START=109 /DNA_END=729 /DNA_ORIENTATION=-
MARSRGTCLIEDIGLLWEEATTSEEGSDPVWLLLILTVVVVSLHVLYVVVGLCTTCLRFIWAWNKILLTNKLRIRRLNLITKIFEKKKRANREQQQQQQAQAQHQNNKLPQEEQDELTCPICLIDFAHGDVVSHGKFCRHTHSCHHECLSMWLRKHPSCPCCRHIILEEVDEPQLIEVEEDDDQVPVEISLVVRCLRMGLSFCGMG